MTAPSCPHAGRPCLCQAAAPAYAWKLTLISAYLERTLPTLTVAQSAALCGQDGSVDLRQRESRLACWRRPRAPTWAWIACPPVFWNWRLAAVSTEACPIACRCARCPEAPTAAAASQFAAVTRDDAFLLFELVFLGAPFLSFMTTILCASSPARYAPSSASGAPGSSAPRYVVLHLVPPGRDGTCPACGRPIDDGGYRTLKVTAVRPNALGVVALAHVACTGAPGWTALPLAPESA